MAGLLPYDRALIARDRRGGMGMAVEGVRRVAIVGSGTVGASWAALFLAHGLDVAAADPAPDAGERARRVGGGGEGAGPGAGRPGAGRRRGPAGAAPAAGGRRPPRGG